METITVKEYADLRNVKVAAVYNAIRANYKLPGVISIKEYGKTKLLEVNKSLITKYEKPCKN